MYKIFFAMVLLLVTMFPLQASAVFTVGQGGTGNTSFPPRAFLFGDGTNPLGATSSPTVGWLVATSSTATSIFSGNVNVFQQLRVQGIDAFEALITPRVFGSDSIFVTNGQIQSGWTQFGPAVFTASSTARGGQLDAQGGDVGVENESDYPNGIYAGDANFYSGGIQTNNGFALQASIEFTGGKWESGIGWTGGSARIIPGTAGLFPGGTGATTSGTISIVNRTPQGEFDAFLDISDVLDSNKTFVFPNSSGTFGLLEINQTWSGINKFSRGSSATTTVNFGEIGDSTSRSCFNTKNTDGQDISFYFIGISMIVENNTCR